MSNALGVAAVTAVLRDRLNNGLLDQSPLLSDVRVTARPPERLASGPTAERNHLNLYLYRVTPNAGYGNERLPARSREGRRLSNPYLAIDLHYLLSAYSETDLTAELLLGYGMQILHETPVLDRDGIRRSLGPGSPPVNGANLPPPFNALQASDLAEQIEQIRITPDPISMEDLSRVWSALNAGLRPSAWYKASVLLIEGVESTHSALPVRRTQLLVPPLRGPQLDELLSMSPTDATPSSRRPVGVGDRLVLRGSGLAGESTRVVLGSVERAPQGAGLSDEQLIVEIPPEVRPGIVPIQVRHAADWPDGSTRPLEDSNVLGLVLRPAIHEPGGAVFDASGPAIVVDFDQDIGILQRATLSLSELDAPAGRAPRSYGVEARTPLEPSVAGGEVTRSIRFAAEGLAAGRYLVRVRVDGAESVLAHDGTSYTAPVVEVPA